MQSATHPSGMFSKVINLKAGRYTQEKYNIFQRKDEILYNKKRKFSAVPFSNKDDQFNEQEQEMQQFQIKKEVCKKNKMNEEAKLKFQPFDKALSRLDVNKVKSNQFPPPDVGYYHPKFLQIDKLDIINLFQKLNRAQHQVWDIKKVFERKTESRQQARSSQNLDELMTKPIPEKLPQKTQGFIELNKQTNRENYYTKSNAPHEERFTQIMENTTWSNFRRTRNYEFRKSVGRDKNSMYARSTAAPNYDPKFEYCKKVIAVMVPQFKKIIPRKPLKPQSSTQNEQYFDYELYQHQMASEGKSQIFHKIASTPNLNKQLPRETDFRQTLPSFMQKQMHSRMDLNNLNQKMLELNHFSDSKFQTCLSSFRVGTTQKKKRKESFEDSFEIQQSF